MKIDEEFNEHITDPLGGERRAELLDTVRAKDWMTVTVAGITITGEHEWRRAISGADDVLRQVLAGALESAQHPDDHHDDVDEGGGQFIHEASGGVGVMGDDEADGEDHP